MFNGGMPMEPWLRLDSESEESFAAFNLYKDMGTDRSLAKVAEKLEKSGTLIERWSQRDHWRKRTLEWDRHVARGVNEQLILGQADMRRRHSNLAMQMQARLANRLLNMPQEQVNQLKPAEIASWMRVAADIEAKARDLPVDANDNRPFEVHVHTTIDEETELPQRKLPGAPVSTTIPPPQ
jgi:hypothetical protein